MEKSGLELVCFEKVYNSFFNGGSIMQEDKTITVTCPKCGSKITEKLSYFKTPGKSCTACCRPFSSTRFKMAIEKALE